MKVVNNDPKVICKLLRAIAGGTDAKASKHDVIFNVAADMIEKMQADIRELHAKIGELVDEAMGEDL